MLFQAIANSGSILQCFPLGVYCFSYPAAVFKEHFLGCNERLVADREEAIRAWS